MALLKYGSGLPVQPLGKPPDGTRHPACRPPPSGRSLNEVADRIYPAFDELVRQAAQGELFYNDDTTMKILAAVNAQAEDGPGAQGRVHLRHPGAPWRASASRCSSPGAKHAGENIAEVLQKRQTGLAPPIQMCDALSRNVPQGFRIVLANCLVHARQELCRRHGRLPGKVPACDRGPGERSTIMTRSASSRA